MKRIITTLVLVSICFGLFSQEITTREENVNFNKESYNAIVTTVHYTDEKTCTKEISNFLKKYKAKVSHKKEIITGSAAIIPQIAPNPLTIIVKMEDNKDKGIVLSFAFNSGFAYLSSASQADQFNYAKSIVQQLALDISKKSYNQALKEKEKSLAAVEKEQKKLKDNKEDLEKSNKDFKKKVEENDKKIDDLSKKLIDKDKEVQTQKEIFTNMQKSNLIIK